MTSSITTVDDRAPTTSARAAPVHVLLTVDFPAAFRDHLQAIDPRIVVHHHPVPELTDPARAVPPEVLELAEVMYTSAVLPGPDRAPRLRWAQLDTSGIDHLRGTHLWESDTVLTTLGGVSPGPLAEWAVMMILAHAHHLRETERLAAARIWPARSYRWQHLMPHNLRRSTVGIVGYGRIGTEVARLARALGMRVLAVRRGQPAAREALFSAPPEVPDVTMHHLDGLQAMLAQCDYVVLTVPLTPQTEHLIGAAELRAMKPGAVLVNGSRGGVVDETALLQVLADGHLDLVASDVFDQEPLPPEHPFWAHPRVVLTPHVAGLAPDYLEAVGRLFATNLRHYLDGRPLVNLVDRERGY